MRTTQREGCALLMIEHRGLPPDCVVALSAGRAPISLKELGTVHIFVALLAGARGGLEVNIDGLGLWTEWLVTVSAGRAAMRSEQRERRAGVIEALEVLPRSSRVAGHTADWRPLGRCFKHPVFEDPFMRIGVARCAGDVRKAELCSRF